MARLYLVRHGKAAAGWGDDPDPGLDDLGRSQAAAMVAGLAPIGPLPLIVSPLQRTRETAAPLAQKWQIDARIEPRVGEIPAPTRDLAGRSEWLGRVLGGRWSEQDRTRLRWRQEVLEALQELTADTVVVTHFVAINVAVGAAQGDDRVTCFRPDHCSRTVVDVGDGKLRLVELGAEGTTRVL